jgi:hypothetical protein
LREPPESVERDWLAILAAVLASDLGMRAGVYRDGAQRLLQIDLPTGQIAFVLGEHDPDWTTFSPAWEIVDDGDDHDEATKWRRIDAYVNKYAVHCLDDIVVASFRRPLRVSRRRSRPCGAKRSLAERFEAQRRARQRLELVRAPARQSQEHLS